MFTNKLLFDFPGDIYPAINPLASMSFSVNCCYREKSKQGRRYHDDNEADTDNIPELRSTSPSLVISRSATSSKKESDAKKIIVNSRHGSLPAGTIKHTSISNEIGSGVRDDLLGAQSLVNSYDDRPFCRPTRHALYGNSICPRKNKCK